MSVDLPDYYFRVRENGAFVFRVDTDNRQRRIEMDQIALANLRNGEIKPHGKRELSEQDIVAIQEWMQERAEILAEREVDDILRTVDHLNLTTQWAQSRTEDDQLEAVTDALLMAMHDLRSVLVRKPISCSKGSPQKIGTEAGADFRLSCLFYRNFFKISSMAEPSPSASSRPVNSDVSPPPWVFLPPSRPVNVPSRPPPPVDGSI